ncbi:MAG TPA: four-carbon acid sugar kinase family protein, partial [Rhizobiales bacterium]|nr:four-carbon acid sugar kinase family protein [Hyphomicrobiales bacterium]
MMIEGDMKILLGCIADDFTGATDLANTLVAGGMRTIQFAGIPGGNAPSFDADAAVIALKIRTCPPAEAIQQALSALKWLKAQGAEQIFFKYCSTFDSTDKGNIGPVAEALLAALDAKIAIACPAFPATGRTVYQGYLFVNGRLISQSPMRDHPLTPMRDPDLVEVLARQTSLPAGLAPYSEVEAGAKALRARLDELYKTGHRLAIVDALNDAHLRTIAKAVSDMPLVTGGSGVATGLPDNFATKGLLPEKAGAAGLPPATGFAVVLSGSCSKATRAQVKNAKERGWPVFELDPLALA